MSGHAADGYGSQRHDGAPPNDGPQPNEYIPENIIFVIPKYFENSKLKIHENFPEWETVFDSQ